MTEIETTTAPAPSDVTPIVTETQQVIEVPGGVAVVTERTEINGREEQNGENSAAATTTTTVVEQNGTTTSNGGANGKQKKKKAVEPEEPRKDLKEDPMGWLKQQISPAVNKANYYALDWLQKVAVEDVAKHQPLPGKGNSVTPKQFVSFLQDGVLLGHLANKLAPGSVEPVHEGEAVKEQANKDHNLQGFIDFAKNPEKGGLADEQVFKVEDVKNGKSGHAAMFNTVIQLGAIAQEKFNTEPLNILQIAEDASKFSKGGILDTIRNLLSGLLNKRQSTASTKPKNGEEPVPSSNGVAITTTTTTTTSHAEHQQVIAESSSQINGEQLKKAEEMPAIGAN